MDTITELTTLDFSSIFISVFVILIGIKAIVSLFEWFIEKIGLETKWMRKNREDKELLLQTSKNLAELQKKHIEDMEKSNERDEEIKKDIKELKDMLIDTKIDIMRSEINDFASRVANGSRCNKDSYTHCIKTYEKYEKILEENNLQNGEVEISMDIIKDSYAQKLKEGF